jgi:hypothetical protein
MQDLRECSWTHFGGATCTAGKRCQTNLTICIHEKVKPSDKNMVAKVYSLAFRDMLDTLIIKSGPVDTPAFFHGEETDSLK